MKKLMTNKKITQKIFLSIILILLISFAVPVKSNAAFSIMDGIVDFAGSLLDVITAMLNRFLVGGATVDSGGTSITNWFMVSPQEFFNKVEAGGAYQDFKYNPSGAKEVPIDIEKLDHSWLEGATFRIPVIRYTPQKIFSNLVPAFDINFVSPKNWDGKDNADTSTTQNSKSTAVQIHSVVSSWYVALRNLAVVGLMVVLVYVGIRMVLCSTASDKAKYKQMLFDWLVALCLLFVLHYIMTFTVTVTQTLAETLNGNKEVNGNNIAISVTKDGAVTSTSSITSNSTGPTTELQNATHIVPPGETVESTAHDIQFNTDLMGYIRFMVESDDTGEKLMFLMLYLAMVIYTVMFTWTYLKRTVNMAFLTIIAPLVALTYPIDKINDGKAQAFNMWLKEYIFNALIQPFHLLIYTIFVSAAIDLAVENPLYAIAALAFLTPAEKLLRKFFGFEKSSTAGALGAAAGIMGGSAAYKALTGMVSGKGKQSNGGNKNIRTKNRNVENPDGPSKMDGFTESSNTGTASAQGGVAGVVGGAAQAAGTAVQAGAQVAGNALQAGAQAVGTAAQAGAQAAGHAAQAGAQAAGHVAQAGAQTAGTATRSVTGLIGNVRPRNPQAAGAGTQAARGVAQGVQPANRSATGLIGNVRKRSIPEHLLKKASTKASAAGRRMDKGIDGVVGALTNKATTTLGNKYWRKQAGKKLAKKAVHGAARVATGAIGAGIGVAAGITGGDLDNVWQLGAAGAGFGATALGNSATGFIDSIGNAGEFIGNAYSGNTATDIALQEQVEARMTDEDYIQAVQDTYRPDGRVLEGQELLDAAERAAYLGNEGFTDPEKATKVMKLEDSINKDFAKQRASSGAPVTQREKLHDEELARIQSITAAKLADKIDDRELVDQTKCEKRINSMKKMIMQQTDTITEKEADKNARESIKRVMQYKKLGIPDWL